MADIVWGVWLRDHITLRGPDLAEETFASLEDAMSYVAVEIEDGRGEQYDVAPARALKTGIGYVPAPGSKPVSIDAREATIPSEDE